MGIVRLKAQFFYFEKTVVSLPRLNCIIIRLLSAIPLSLIVALEVGLELYE